MADTLANLLSETRHFPPPADLAANANVKAEAYERAREDQLACQAANALADLGVRKGDRVAIYLPMIPEAAVAMLACARLGAAHSVVFGGFSAQALVDRITDADAKLVITSDGGYRRGAPSALKPAVDDAVTRR